MSAHKSPRTHCLHCANPINATDLASKHRIVGLYGFCSPACEMNYAVAHERCSPVLTVSQRQLLANIVYGDGSFPTKPQMVQVEGDLRGDLLELAKLGLVVLHGRLGAVPTPKGDHAYIRANLLLRARETVDEPGDEPTDDDLAWMAEQRALDRAERYHELAHMEDYGDLGDYY